MAHKKSYVTQENGQTYYISQKGNKFLQIGNVRYRGLKTSEPILERLDYLGAPTLNDMFGFASFNDFAKWLAVESADITGRDVDVTKSLVIKNNDVVAKMSQEWMSTRDKNVYLNPDYLFETICCSLYVTGEFHKKGLLGKNCGIDNLLRSLHHLDYHQKECKILDMGSGLGLTTLYAAKFCPKSTVYYNDASPASKELFKRLVKLSGLTNIVILDDWRDPPQGLDIVLAFEFIEHIEHPTLPGVGDPMSPIQHVHSCIKPDGYLMYSTMWNAEQNNGSTIGHFTSYKFGNEMVVLPHGKSDERSRLPHRFFTNEMKKLGYSLICGGRKGTEWDWKNHYPYVYKKAMI